MKFQSDEPIAFRELLRWRRDVRHFLPEPIDERLVEQLQADMEFAPSVGNSRPWRVVRVDSDDLRAQVRGIFETCNAAAASGYEGERRDQYLALKLAGLDIAPLQLAVFTECAPAEGHGLGRQTMPQTLQQSTAMAIHTLWLAARSLNLGLGMVSILDPSRMERLFDVPETWVFSAYLCLGWPSFEDDTPLLDRAGWQENFRGSWIRR
jgi:5,6-dimethylbenzimidazole synthase